MRDEAEDLRGEAACDAASYASFVETRWRALVHFGFLLTGDWQSAEDLTQTALELTWRRWTHAVVERPESYVKAAMVNRMRSRWRTRRPEEIDRPLGEPVAAAEDDQTKLVGLRVVLC